METWWLPSFRETPDLDVSVNGLTDQLYCSMCQHVGVEIVPSFLTSAPGLIRWAPCMATGEISALWAALGLLPASSWVDYCLQVLVPLISLLEETQRWPEMHFSVFHLPSCVQMNTLPFQINAWLNQGQSFNVLLGRCGSLWLLLMWGLQGGSWGLAELLSWVWLSDKQDINSRDTKLGNSFTFSLKCFLQVTKMFAVLMWADRYHTNSSVLDAVLDLLSSCKHSHHITLLSVFPRPLHDILMWWYCRFVEAVCSRAFYYLSACLFFWCFSAVSFWLHFLFSSFFFFFSSYSGKEICEGESCVTHMGKDLTSVFLSGGLSQEGPSVWKCFITSRAVSESWMERLLKQEQTLQLPPEMDWERQTPWAVPVQNMRDLWHDWQPACFSIF